MKNYIIFALFMALVMVSCSNQSKSSADEDDHGHETATEVQKGDHEHETQAEAQHEDIKLQMTAYTDAFELYAEADPFVVGESSNILAHFTCLPGWVPLEEGKVKVSLVIQGISSSLELPAATRKGIFSFALEAKQAGAGQLIFEIETDQGLSQLTVPGIVVYEDDHEAMHEAEELEIHNENGIVFTKEQSWKIDFATEDVKKEPFGQVIRTSAMIEPSIDEIHVVSARTSGIVILSEEELLEGHELSKGTSLLSISGSSMAENNTEVQYREAKNNFERTKTDYERLKKLSNDQIVSERELLAAENAYQNASARYETLKRSFSASGQEITSPVSGYIKHVHIANGQYVAAGDPLLSIVQNKSIHLVADVQQKYIPILDQINDATIRNTNTGRTYSLKELDGEVISRGKATNEDNYLIPVHMHINKAEHLIPGSFVEVYLKTSGSKDVLTIPTTSILENQGFFSVYVQITPELFELRNVTIGGSDGLRTEIKEGLKAGERVVSKGAVLMKLAQVTGTLDAHSGHVH